MKAFWVTLKEKYDLLPRPMVALVGAIIGFILGFIVG